MSNPPLKILTIGVADGSAIVFAKNKFKQLERMRLSSNMALVQKRLVVGGQLVFIRSSNWSNVVMVEGAIAQIYLYGAEQYGLYSYDNDTMTKKGGMSEIVYLADGDIDSMATPVARDLFITTAYHLNHDKVFVDPFLETIFTVGAGEISQYRQDDSGVLTLPGTLQWLLDTAGVQNPFLYLGGIEHAELWNSYRGVYFYTLNPENSNFFESFRWRPSIVFKEPGNGSMIEPGLYYGGNDHLYGGGDNLQATEPANSIDVSFVSLMKTLNVNPVIYQHGYVELLKGINGSECAVVALVLSSGNVADMPNQQDLITLDVGYYYTATVMQGSEHCFRFNVYDDFGTTDLTVDAWSTRFIGKQTDLGIDTGDTFGVVISSATKLQVYFCTANITDTGIGKYSTKIYDSPGKASHSISSDGRHVAIFNYDGAIISDVVVFDLQAREDDPEGAPFVQICSSTVVSQVSGLGGAIIPKRLEEDYRNTLAGEVPQLVSSGQSDVRFEPAMGGVITGSPFEAFGLWGWKVLCEDGINATAKMMRPSCLGHGVTVIKPVDKDAPTSLYIGGNTYSADTFFGVIGNLPYLLAAGFRDPVNPIIFLAKWETTDGESVARPVSVSGTNISVTYGDTLPDISISQGVSGNYYANDGVGDVIMTYSGDGEWVADPEYVGGYHVEFDRDQCGDTFSGGVINASSSCGQTAEPVTIDGDEGAEEFTATVDDIVWLAGGTPPYTYKVSSIDNIYAYLPDDGYYLYGVNGCDEKIDVTFYDACGREIKIDHPENEVSPIEIFGEEDINSGAVYRARGGCHPYSFSISCGEIDADTGEVLSTSGCCGAGSVTVTSADGQSASMDVRFQEGQWVQTAYHRYSDYNPDGYDVEVVGRYKYHRGLKVNAPNSNLYSSCAEAPDGYTTGCGYSIDVLLAQGEPEYLGLSCDDINPITGDFMCLSLYYLREYEWQCL